MISRQETIEEILQLGANFLTINPCMYANPKVESEILLAFALNQHKEYLITHAKETISKQQLRKYRQLLSLRAKKWPISQIVNNKEFYSRNFFVNKDVLTPRPETEHIIDALLIVLKQLSQKDSPIQIIDIGTGSGCIAITIALEMNSIKLDITAIDSSARALKVAKKNWNKYKQLTKNNIDFLLEDIHCYQPLKKFDVIVSNPPYIPTKDIATVADDVLAREPRQALFAKNNGLEFYTAIKKFCDSKLKEESGILILEIYPTTYRKVITLFSGYKCSTIRDYFGNNRVLVLNKTTN